MNTPDWIKQIVVVRPDNLAPPAPSLPRSIMVSQGETALPVGEIRALSSVAEALPLITSDQLREDLIAWMEHAAPRAFQCFLLEVGADEARAYGLVKELVGPGELVLRHISVQVHFGGTR